ncbi:hypothetical protein CGG86_23645, partial [Vibrio parahaemolyticus]
MFIVWLFSIRSHWRFIVKSLTPRLASAIAEVPYDVFSGELNNVPTDVAKQFEFDTKLKLFKAT